MAPTPPLTPPPVTVGGNDPTDDKTHQIAEALKSYADQRAAAEAKNSKHNHRVRQWGRVSAVGALVYTLITALIFIASIRSIQEARRATHAAGRAADAATAQAKVAEDTEKRQLRAYVFVAAATMRNFAMPNMPNIIVRVKNFGQTPAYEVTMDLGISLIDLAAPGTFDDPGHPSPPTPIGPGVDVKPILTANEHLDDRIIGAVKAGRSAYFAYGTIKYKDAFGEGHWTKVRGFLRLRNSLMGAAN
jgi:hypothetical protein